MGRLLPCLLVIACAVGCGNPSRVRVDAEEITPIIPDSPSTPGAFGDACSRNTDCESGYCVEPVGNTGGVCSRICNDDCPQGWECRTTTLPQATVKLCVQSAPQLCLACTNDTECGGGACLQIDGGGRCATPCTGQCPTGYTCTPDGGGTHSGSFCQPVTASCSCSPAMANAMRSCSNMNTTGTCFGTQTCGASGWSTCTARTPVAETCDGVDNDCNFIIDDGVGGGQGCTNTNGFGSCAGVRQCNGSAGFVCVGQTPAAEACDGVDNNCNGSVDEAYPGLGSGCTAGVGACVRYGSQRCNSTQNGLDCSAVAGAPQTELCNQVDDNCDGNVDEPFKTGVMALGAVCSAGQGVCARYGTYVCNGTGSGTMCSATAGTNSSTETCNYLDDNCDGVVDNGYRNAGTGFYDTNTNCGACGNDCTTLYTAQNSFGVCAVTTSPQCVMRCNPGTGNLNGSTVDGCEFVLDATAIYVSGADATAIDDGTCGLGPTGTGTGNYPCKTITQGLLRAMMAGRTNVLVADATYNEGVILLNGKNVLGGYRSDTWERHVATTNTVISGFTSVNSHDRTIVAPFITAATVFEGFVVRGSFNTKPSGNSYAIYISSSNANLVIKNNQIFGGRGGSGVAGPPGVNGAAGVNAAAYSAGSYDSLQTGGNPSAGCGTGARIAYGGGVRTCASSDDVGGGNGGGNNCSPVRSTQNSTVTSQATAGQPGAGAGGGTGGAAGARGYDAVMSSNTCYVPVLMNGTVLPMQGTAGAPGGPGTSAAAAPGCSASIGSIALNEWIGGSAGSGAVGADGGGGGGGGAGGGADCNQQGIPGCSVGNGLDLLGAHGGGAGTGGCGGAGGSAGNAGGGAFGIFVVGGSAPTITTNTITIGTGGQGGQGGIGGAGGLGGVGTQGGQVGSAGNSLLFCTGKGGRGGDGGDGGAGAGGGGGCGRSSFGIYTSNVGTPAYCGTNTVSGGSAGSGGAGGFSGGNSGGSGAAGVLQTCISI